MRPFALAALFVVATFGTGGSSQAQQAAKVYRVGALFNRAPNQDDQDVELLRQGLGGNVIGITNHDPELATRQLKVLREIFPKLDRVAILSDADIPGADSSGFAPIERSNIAAARAMKITPQVLKLRGPAPDFDAAFSAMAAEKAEVLVVLEVPVPFGNRKRIAEMAAARRLPTMFWGGASTAGGMMSYGTSFADGYPLMPVVIDRILKGAKPADTPFEVVSRREFVVNHAIARALGVIIPEAVLKRADRILD
ncbi:MAG: ABC transporter substrate binding protein [Gemmatimonadaceae bacterium]